MARQLRRLVFLCWSSWDWGASRAPHIRAAQPGRSGERAGRTLGRWLKLLGMDHWDMDWSHCMTKCNRPHLFPTWGHDALEGNALNAYNAHSRYGACCSSGASTYVDDYAVLQILFVSRNEKFFVGIIHGYLSGSGRLSIVSIASLSSYYFLITQASVKFQLSH